MNKVEFARTAIDLFDRRHMQCIGIAHGAVEPQSAGPHGLELRRGHQITTGEQGDIVDAKGDKLLREPQK